MRHLILLAAMPCALLARLRRNRGIRSAGPGKVCSESVPVKLYP
jgi:hypothetical protein